MLTEQYALTEAGYVTVRLLQRFDDVEVVEDFVKVPKVVILTLHPKDGVSVRLRKVK